MKITRQNNIYPKIRPLILAGGRGNRFRPRSKFLPKPLLPVDGKPLLWHVLSSFPNQKTLPPLIVLGFKGDFIQAFFETYPVEFCHLPGKAIAKVVLEVTKSDKEAMVFLGMSADVLLPKSAISEMLEFYQTNGQRDSLLCVRAPSLGDKKWVFKIDNNQLSDIYLKATKFYFERILAVFNRSSLKKVEKFLGTRASKRYIPNELRTNDEGWNLLIKAMVSIGIPVAAKISKTPFLNVNLPRDLEIAQDFVQKHMKG